MLLLLLQSSPGAPGIVYDVIEFTDVTLSASTLTSVTLSAATLTSVTLEPD